MSLVEDFLSINYHEIMFGPDIFMVGKCFEVGTDAHLPTTTKFADDGITHSLWLL
jgi:hypothetical protein